MYTDRFVFISAFIYSFFCRGGGGELAIVMYTFNLSINTGSRGRWISVASRSASNLLLHSKLRPARNIQ